MRLGCSLDSELGAGARGRVGDNQAGDIVIPDYDADDFLNEKEAYNYRGSHSHDWKEHDNGDAFCPICGGWRSVVGA